MNLKKTFKKIIATVEVAAMTLALMAGFSVAKPAEVLGAEALTVNTAKVISSDKEETFTFVAPKDGYYYFYSETTDGSDPYADLITETDDYYNDDKKDYDFWIEAKLSEGEECELIVSSFEVEDGEAYETTVYVYDQETAEGIIYRLDVEEYNYVTLGESHNITAEILNVAGKTMEEIPEGYSVEWYKHSDGEPGEKLDVEGLTYSIDELTNDHVNCIASNYTYYEVYLYKGEDKVNSIYTYLYDIEKSVYLGSNYIYAKVGETVELEPLVYDYNDDKVDLSQKTNYTFKWYRVTVDEEGDYTGYDEIEGLTGNNCTINVTEADFCEKSNDYACFFCELYVDGELIDEMTYEICDKDKYIEVHGGTYYVNKGDTLTLTPRIYDYYENEIDIDDENLEFTWYVQNEYYDEIEVGTGSTYTIDSVDFIDGEAYYYVEVLYKGETYDSASFYIYDEYISYYGGFDEIIAEKGSQVSLDLVLYDHDDNLITEFDNSFTFEWCKAVYDDEGEYVCGEILGKEPSYMISAADDSDFFGEDTEYVRYLCLVYRDGNFVTEYEARIYEKNTYWAIKEPEPIYAEVGDSVTFTPVIIDGNGQEIDINDERFTYEWTNFEFETVGEDSTYTIDSVSIDDFCVPAYGDVYEVYITDSVTNRTDWAYFYLFEKEEEPTTEPTTGPNTEVPTTVAPDSSTEVPTTLVTEPTTEAPTTVAPETVKKPAKAKIKKITPKKKAAKKVKISLKKIKGADGYQVAIYKTKKNAKKNKKALVKKTFKKIKVTVKSKKLKNKKKLFVKARAYKLDGKRKVWGKWSKIKNVKIKK